MARQITIIGLGQIGASFGLALEQYKSAIQRVGHDKKPEAAKAAQARGAVDEINYNLPASVRNADLVLLALPFSEIESTLEIIGPDLKEGAVVMDTAPVKGLVAEWASRHIPAGRSYVGLVPSIGPDHLLNVGAGLSAARANLFHESVFLVCPANNVSESTVKLVTDLLQLIGAGPLFSDAVEADSVMAALHTLPQLMALALMDATMNQPGWKEARKMAGRPFALSAAAALYHDESASIHDAAHANKDNVARVLGNAIQSLTALRESILASNPEDERIDEAYYSGLQWLNERLGADWISEEVQKINVPSFGDRIAQSFLGSWVRPERKK